MDIYEHSLRNTSEKNVKQWRTNEHQWKCWETNYWGSQGLRIWCAMPWPDHAYWGTSDELECQPPWKCILVNWWRKSRYALWVDIGQGSSLDRHLPLPNSVMFNISTDWHYMGAEFWILGSVFWRRAVSGCGPKQSARMLTVLRQ